MSAFNLLNSPSKKTTPPPPKKKGLYCCKKWNFDFKLFAIEFFHLFFIYRALTESQFSVLSNLQIIVNGVSKA